jgi:hypothetical protein
MIILQTTLSMCIILKMTYAFVSMAPQTAMFAPVIFRDGPVSGFFLYVHER